MTTRELTVLGYLALAAALVLVELSARREGSRQVPFAALVRRAMGQRSAQLALLLVWWWIGWHFLLAL